MSLATSNWAKDAKKSIINEFKKCFDDTMERLEKSAKDMIQMLKNSSDEMASADPTNKKKIKEEFQKNKDHVNNFKDNTKKQMKEILSTLKQNPGVNKFLYKKAFEKEFNNFMEKMSLLLSGDKVSSAPIIREEVKNIVIEFTPKEYSYSQAIPQSSDIFKEYNEMYPDDTWDFPQVEEEEEAAIDTRKAEREKRERLLAQEEEGDSDFDLNGGKTRDRRKTRNKKNRQKNTKRFKK
jgi:hypothetical protein